MSDDQITIRELRPREYSLEFPYNAEFIEYLKQRIPVSDRSYDAETHIWRFKDHGQTLNAIEGVAVQKFRYAVRWYKNADGELVMRNLKTGAEAVQKGLFA